LLLLRGMRRLSFLLLFLTLAPATAWGNSWTPRVSLGSDFPVSAGLRAAVTTPFGLEASGSLGTLPAIYAEAINDFAISMGGYDEETGDIIRESLRSSTVFAGGLGYDIWSRLRLHGNYSIVSLGGATSTPDIVASVAGIPLPFGQEGRRVTIDSRLHMLGFGFSWPFRLHPMIDLRVGLGARFTVDADTQVELAARNDAEEEYERDAAAYLDSIYTEYAHTPVMSVRLEVGF